MIQTNSIYWKTYAKRQRARNFILNLAQNFDEHMKDWKMLKHQEKMLRRAV